MIASFKDRHPKIHQTAFIAPDVSIIGDVTIGRNASVWFGSIIRGDVNHVRIGDRTNIQDATVIHVSSKDHPTVLENDITVGHRATLHGCFIETGCLIGIGAVLLDGVRVGRNSLVGAGSLLTPGTVIPPGSLVLGSPARVRRPLTDEEIRGIENNVAAYVELSSIYLKAAGS